MKRIQIPAGFNKDELCFTRNTIVTMVGLMCNKSAILLIKNLNISSENGFLVFTFKKDK